MPDFENAPTPYADVNAMLRELMAGIRSVLGARLVGLYLEGSLASGDFDQHSDIDFVAVTREEVSGELFTALQSMHDRLAQTDSVWAIQLEGTYISRPALRRFDPALAVHPNLERGPGERLKMVYQDHSWDIHRYILHTGGIPLAGPAPDRLVDPVSPDGLRRAVRSILSGWAGQILAEPAYLEPRGYQSYTVLSLCRILYTLSHGMVVSKPAAARWALENLDPGWGSLIERALEGRQQPELAASQADVDGTLALVRFVLEQAREDV